MSYISVDVEADGPCPGLFSMVCFGAVVVEPALGRTFYGKTRPITGAYMEDALAVSGFSRLEHEAFDDPAVVMQAFAEWAIAHSVGRPVFISDNPAFDWQFINYYFCLAGIKNPFGFSARRIGDLYCGLMKQAGVNTEWKKKYRRTAHTHHPVDDARGNAEALLAFQADLGLQIKF